MSKLNPRFPDLDVPKTLTLMERFIMSYLGHYLDNLTPQFHREIYWILQNPQTYGRALILAPRGFAKSVIVCVFFPLFIIYIMTHPELAGSMYRKVSSILIITASKELAMEWIGKIAYEVQNNKKLLKLFGDLSTEGEANGMWQKDKIRVINSMGDAIEIRAMGRESRVRGPHPDIVIIDDLEDDESAVSETQCQAIESWLKSAIEGMLRKAVSNIYWIGTVIAPECVIDNAFKKKKWSDSWFRVKYSAYKDNGDSIWPDAFPVEFLKQKEENMGTIQFAAEYLNEPLVAIDPIFRREHFRYFEQGDLPVNMVKVMAIDPAVKEKEMNDYTAIVLIGVCMSGSKKMNIYVLDCDRGHWGTDGKVKRLYSMYAAYNPDHVIVETSAQQEFFKDILVMKARDMGYYLPIREVKPFRDKVTRTKAVSHLVEQGYVYFRSAGQDDLIDELVMFPYGKRDDYVDALQMCLDMAKTLHNRISAEDSEDIEENLKSPISKIGWVA